MKPALRMGRQVRLVNVVVKSKESGALILGLTGPMIEQNIGRESPWAFRLNALIMSPDLQAAGAVASTVDPLHHILLAHRAPEDVIQVVRRRSTRKRPPNSCPTVVFRWCWPPGAPAKCSCDHRRVFEPGVPEAFALTLREALDAQA